jgi:translation elongation factor EF-G
VAKYVSDRDLLQKDRRLALQQVMRKWLPLAASVLKMVTRLLPSPVAAQKSRVSYLCGTPPRLPPSAVHPLSMAATTWHAIQSTYDTVKPSFTLPAAFFVFAFS